jgi:hypothetical protein
MSHQLLVMSSEEARCFRFVLASFKLPLTFLKITDEGIAIKFELLLPHPQTMRREVARSIYRLQNAFL